MEPPLTPRLRQPQCAGLERLVRGVADRVHRAKRSHRQPGQRSETGRDSKRRKVDSCMHELGERIRTQRHERSEPVRRMKFAPRNPPLDESVAQQRQHRHQCAEGHQRQSGR